ncbi:hypothetical protein ACVWWO_009539 [Bradyrhizobium sp. F1.13.1]
MQARVSTNSVLRVWQSMRENPSHGLPNCSQDAAIELNVCDLQRSCNSDPQSYALRARQRPGCEANAARRITGVTWFLALGREFLEPDRSR